MTTFEFGFLGFTFLMLLGCIGVLFNLHLSWKRTFLHETQRNRALDECRRELHMLSSNHLGVGKRVERFGRELNRLREQLDALERDQGSVVPYQQIARLAEQGTQIADLVDAFGLSKAEAELMAKLHAGKPATSNALPTSVSASH